MRETIWVVSDDPAFKNAVIESCNRGASPSLELLFADSAGVSALSGVVVLDGAEPVSRLTREASLAIIVDSGEVEEAIASTAQRVVRLRREAGWADVAALLALDTCRCEQAVSQLAELQEKLQAAERFAELGKGFLGEKHGLANALTSVMGHAELMLTDSTLPEDVRRKIGTVHAMSVRIHEVLQRLASLDRDLQTADQQVALERARKASGSSS